MSIIQQGKPKPRLRRILLVLLGLYVIIATSLYIFQENLLFLPTVLEQEHQYRFEHPFEELYLETDTDALINALHFRAENAKGVLIYFHGNAADLSRWGNNMTIFVEKGYDVLVMDYRTFGKSRGELSENALYHDAQFCYDYLKARYNESEITIYGRSLGTGIATFLASKNNPKQLILETPYYSMVDVAQSRYPIFPVKLLLKYKLPSHAYLQNVKCPVTMFHGTDDQVIPLESAVKLYQSATNGRVSLTVIEDGGHNNLGNFESYRQKLDEVLR